MRTQQPPPPSRLRPVLSGLLVGILGLLVVGHLVGGWYVSDLIREEVFEARVWTEDEAGSFAPRGGPGERGPSLEEVTYESPLGEMDAWYLDGRRSEWIVHVHGEGTGPQEVLPLMAGIERLGFPQLAIAYRNDPGQPADPDGLLGYGLTEWQDLRAAVDHALAEGASEVFLVGHSAGAAIVVATLARDDSGVAGAVLDSPTLDLSRAVDAWAGRTDIALGIPIPPTLLGMGKLFTELRLDVDWADFDRLEDADRLRVPILVFHGTEDRTIPVETSRELVERRPQLVTLVEVEAVGHGEPRTADPDAYEGEVARFLARATR